MYTFPDSVLQRAGTKRTRRKPFSLIVRSLATCIFPISSCTDDVQFAFLKGWGPSSTPTQWERILRPCCTSVEPKFKERYVPIITSLSSNVRSGIFFYMISARSLILRLSTKARSSWLLAWSLWHRWVPVISVPRWINQVFGVIMVAWQSRPGQNIMSPHAFFFFLSDNGIRRISEWSWFLADVGDASLPSSCPCRFLIETGSCLYFHILSIRFLWRGVKGTWGHAVLSWLKPRTYLKQANILFLVRKQLSKSRLTCRSIERVVLWKSIQLATS